MNPDQTAPREQSDPGPYCLQKEHMLSRVVSEKSVKLKMYLDPVSLGSICIRYVY